MDDMRMPRLADRFRQLRLFAAPGGSDTVHENIIEPVEIFEAYPLAVPVEIGAKCFFVCRRRRVRMLSPRRISPFFSTMA
jgi:hypothetical protein